MVMQATLRQNFLHFLFGLVLLFIPIVFFLNHENQTALAEAETHITVTAASLNVRTLPSIEGKIIQVVHRGDIFKVTDTQAGWDRIELISAETGWVKSDAVQPTLGETYTVIQSKVNGLNVHRSADLQSTIISHLSPGHDYKVMNQSGQLIEVQSPDGPGWVASQWVTQQLKQMDSAQKKASVTAAALTIRKLPESSSQALGYLHKDDLVRIQSEQAGWAKIMTSTNIIGWISKSYLSFSANDKTKKNQSNGTTTSSTPTKSSNQTVQLAAPPSNKNVLKGKTIVLDPGHGGKDDGTTSVSGTPEKTLTLETAELVAQKLSLAGAHVVLTRTNDTYISLDKRVSISEAQNADAFISLHYNASPIPFVKGISSYYYTKNKDQELASDILDGVLSSTGLSSRGTRFDDLHVLRENTQPCTLIELGFVSNKSEDQAVETNRFRIEVADGVYNGLVTYFSSK